MQEIHKTALEKYITSVTELPKVIVIYGPTACGKTALSIDVAKHIESEIISVDSRQIYRGMDIWTGKIKQDEMQGIPHHMIDICDPSEVFSVVDFVRWALPIIERIESGWKIPILCGGTGLYIDGLISEMSYPDVSPDWAYRAELEEIRISKWNQKLWNMLEEVDPDYAHTLEPENYRYVMRWLEVYRQTGQSKWLSRWQKIQRFSPLYITPYDDIHRETLYQNINTRVEYMFADWLLWEVQSLIEKYGSECPGLTTIGYREVVEALEWKMNMEDAQSLIQQRSRNYAKRQITWNKRYI